MPDLPCHDFCHAVEDGSGFVPLSYPRPGLVNPQTILPSLSQYTGDNELPEVPITWASVDEVLADDFCVSCLAVLHR